MKHRSVVVAVLAAVLVVVPLTTAAAASPHASWRFGAPKVGSCYNASYKASEANWLGVGTVACSRSHTLWVTAVAEVSKSAVDRQPFHGTNAALLSWYYEDCVPSISKAIGSIGRGYALSDYAGLIFIPTKVQQRHGAHWVSCEVALPAGTSYVTSTRRHPSKVGGTLSDRIRMCGTKTFTSTVCTRKHVYRSSAFTTVAQKPTRANGRRAAEGYCPSRVTSGSWMYYQKAIGEKRFLLTCLSKDDH